MAKEFAKKFYAGTKWRKCRAAYISHRKSIDGGMCESCREMPGYIVHHKEELNPGNINSPDVTLGFGNLKYDCLTCHNKEGKIPDAADGLVRYEFTPDGDVIEAASPPSRGRQGAAG